MTTTTTYVDAQALADAAHRDNTAAWAAVEAARARFDGAIASADAEAEAEAMAAYDAAHDAASTAAQAAHDAQIAANRAAGF